MNDENLERFLIFVLGIMVTTIVLYLLVKITIG
jgi:hypothetical protein